MGQKRSNEKGNNGAGGRRNKMETKLLRGRLEGRGEQEKNKYHAQVPIPMLKVMYLSEMHNKQSTDNWIGEQRK